MPTYRVTIRSKITIQTRRTDVPAGLRASAKTCSLHGRKIPRLLEDELVRVTSETLSHRQQCTITPIGNGMYDVEFPAVPSVPSVPSVP